MDWLIGVFNICETVSCGAEYLQVELMFSYTPTIAFITVVNSIFKTMELGEFPYRFPICIHGVKGSRSKLQINPSTRFFLPNLKHDLHPDEERTTRNDKVHDPRVRPQHLRQQALQSIQPQREPDKVGNHHHEYVTDGTDGANDTVRRRARPPARGREEQGADDFRQDEERDEPAPHEQTEVDVMPEGDEGEDDEEVEDLASSDV